MEPRARKHGQTLLVSLLLSTVTLAVFWPVHLHDFVNYDDPAYVTENTRVQSGVTWPGVAWAFRTGHAANWHPLTWLSHMLDCEIYGLRPGGHHVTSLLLHAANALLLFLLFRRMTGAMWRSAFVAALFALHPLHVESVAWIAERKDVLSTFFGLLALWAYVHYVQTKVQSPKSNVTESPATQHATCNTQHAPLFYLLALLLFALSLMSKPMLVTLPFLLLLLDYWPLQRFPSPALQHSDTPTLRLLLEKLPFFALTAASCVVTFLVQQHGGAVPATDELPLGARLGNAPVAYCGYLAKTFWPLHLSVFYPYHGWWSAGIVTLTGLFLAAVTVAAVLSRGRWPAFMVGWLWFLGTLVPVIGVVQVGSQFIADRYSYMPLIGLFVLVAWLPYAGRRAGAVAAALALLLCLGGARTQVRYWQNSETLFRHALAVTSANYVAHANLASALMESGQPDAAQKEFAASLAIHPDSYTVIYALGSLVRTNGDSVAALKLFNRALQQRPHDATAHYNQGIALAALKHPEEAIAQYREAVQLDPNLAQAQNNLAGLLISHGKVSEGLAHALAALRLDPKLFPAHLNAGNALFLQDKFPDAEAHYRFATKLKPNSAEACLNLGKALVNQDKFPDAEIYLKEAARLRPTDAEPHQILARIYTVQQRANEAAEEEETAASNRAPH